MVQNKTSPQGRYGLIAYFAELDGDDETLCLQESEIADARWFTPEEVTKPTNDISVFFRTGLEILE